MHSYIDFNNIVLASLQRILQGIPIDSLDNIDFNKVPILTLNKELLTVSVKYISAKYKFTDYFKEFEDKRFGYFLYTLIINFSRLSHELYGGQIRKFFNYEYIKDLDFRYNNTDEPFNFYTFCCELENDILLFNHSLHLGDNQIINFIKDYFSDNIYIIIYVLYKIIYNDELHCQYIEINTKFKFLRLKLQNFHIDISYRIYRESFDFNENMMRLNTNFELESIREYRTNQKLAMSLISRLSIKKSELFKDHIIQKSILANIMEMLGSNFICVLISAFHIVNKILVRTHHQCFQSRTSVPSRYSHMNLYHESQHYQKYIASLIKINIYRKDKFEKLGFKICTTKKCCSRGNCVSFMHNLYIEYIEGKYTVNFETYVENRGLGNLVHPHNLERLSIDRNRIINTYARRSSSEDVMLDFFEWNQQKNKSTNNNNEESYNYNEESYNYMIKQKKYEKYQEKSKKINKMRSYDRTSKELSQI